MTSAAFSPDGTRVITASDDHTARVWDAATGKPFVLALEHHGEVRSAAFSPRRSAVCRVVRLGRAKCIRAQRWCACVTQISCTRRSGAFDVLVPVMLGGPGFKSGSPREIAVRKSHAISNASKLGGTVDRGRYAVQHLGIRTLMAL